MSHFSDNETPIILIAEDHQETRSLYCNALKKAGNVIECKNGKEALSQIESQIPDLVISDIDMPDLNGFELCRQIKENDLTSHIPVVLLTGSKTSVQERINGVTLGADDYLLKPCDPLELRARALNLIEQRKRLLEKFSRTIRLSWDMSVAPPDRPTDEAFLQRLLHTFQKHIHDDDFHIEHIAEKVGLSRSQLHRKVKALTGKNITEFLQEARLKRAEELLKLGRWTVSDVAYQVGYTNMSYFSKIFKDAFGVLPSEVSST
ncbi:MAG: response regulator [Chloroherpetonaceae bacterium]